jgi:hypothetical protein
MFTFSFHFARTRFFTTSNKIKSETLLISVEKETIFFAWLLIGEATFIILKKQRTPHQLNKNTAHIRKSFFCDSFFYFLWKLIAWGWGWGGGLCMYRWICTLDIFKNCTSTSSLCIHSKCIFSQEPKYTG